ncbi:hypothetical protein [Streptomyces albidoflavus]|uniref:hypothetical protein n=1 Tax=Streptomyces albidoflavus TaxID=1886 RepID=UPI0033DF2FA9
MLRIVSWNIRDGGWADPDAVTRTLAQLQPDLTAVQEAKGWSSNKYARLHDLADALDAPHHLHTLSNHDGVDLVTYIGRRLRTHGHALDVTGGTAHVGIQLLRLSLRDPEALPGLDMRPHKWFSFLNAHLSYVHPPARAHEAGFMTEYAGGLGLAAGDMNTSLPEWAGGPPDPDSWDGVLPRKLRSRHLAPPATPGGFEPSDREAMAKLLRAGWHSPGILPPTAGHWDPVHEPHHHTPDHILLSEPLLDRVRVLDYRVIDVPHSDHKPVVLDLDA